MAYDRERFNPDRVWTGCCCAGCRNIPPDKAAYVEKELRREIESAIGDGCDSFISGYAPGAEECFGKIVVGLRPRFPDIRMAVDAPHRLWLHGLIRNKRTKEIVFNCEDAKVHGEKYGPAVYEKRNRHMLEKSRRIIAVLDGSGRGAAAQALRMAREMGREVRIIQI